MHSRPEVALRSEQLRHHAHARGPAWRLPPDLPAVRGRSTRTGYVVPAGRRGALRDGRDLRPRDRLIRSWLAVAARRGGFRMARRAQQLPRQALLRGPQEAQGRHSLDAGARDGRAWSASTSTACTRSWSQRGWPSADTQSGIVDVRPGATTARVSAAWWCTEEEVDDLVAEIGKVAA